jgi:hypothetical protein
MPDHRAITRFCQQLGAIEGFRGGEWYDLNDQRFTDDILKQDVFEKENNGTIALNFGCGFQESAFQQVRLLVIFIMGNFFK